LKEFIKLKLNQIEDNSTFKLSAKPSEDFRQSIKKNGIIINPVVFKDENKYILISGHNRVGVAREYAFDYVEVLKVPKKFRCDFIRNEILRKKLEGIFAPASLIQGNINPLWQDCSALLKDQLIPFFHSHEKCQKLAEFKNFLNYSIERRVNYKILESFVKLKKEASEIVDSSVMKFQPKIAQIKELIKSLDEISEKVTLIPDHVNSHDSMNELLQFYFTIRYPEYSRLKNEADVFKARYNNMPFQIEFPEYMEGGFADLTFRVKAESKVSEIEKNFQTLSSIDLNSLHKILNGDV
jgi:Cu/Ag efflux protein CusF